MSSSDVQRQKEQKVLMLTRRLEEEKAKLAAKQKGAGSEEHGVIEEAYLKTLKSEPKKAEVAYLKTLLGTPLPDQPPSMPDHHPDVGDASANSCPWLSSNSGEEDSKYPPSNGGVVPYTIYAVVILDVAAVGLVIPLFSLFAKTLGGGAAFTGLLGTTYGIMQLIGASFFGGRSDRCGQFRFLQFSEIQCAYDCFLGLVAGRS
jgi:hypothetical protein